MSRELRDPHEILKKNETICWEGEPVKAPVLETGFRNRILLRWIATPIVAIFLLFFLASGKEHVQMRYFTMVLLVASVVMYLPIMDWRKAQKQRYWITDQRVISQDQYDNFFYMSMDGIDSWRIVRGVANEPCLVIGSRLFPDMENKMRIYAGRPLIGKKKHPTGLDPAMGMVLYGIHDVEGAEQALKDHWRT